MKREINLLYASSVMIGVIIGSGIFVSPTAIVEHSGSVGLSLILWALAGTVEILIALSYCELACMFPKAGGEYAFLKIVMPSELPAFLVAWINFIALDPSFYAILAITSAKYILQPFFLDCAAPIEAVKILSIWILLSVVVLNSVYVKYIARVQTLFTVCKIVPLIIIIIIGLVEFFIYQNRQNVAKPFEGTIWSVGGISSAILMGKFAYGGWTYLFNLCEEIKHPEKIIPKATVLSISMVILLYLLTNFCYMVVLTPREIIGAEAVALSYAEKTIGWFALCIPILVVFSTVGSLNGALLGGSRMTYATARDGLLPQVFSFVHVKYQTPWMSVWTHGALTLLYIISGDVLALIDYQVYVFLFVLITCICCVIWLRWKQPDLERPFKPPVILHITAATVLIWLFSVKTYDDPKMCGAGILMGLSGVPIYMVFVWGRKHLKINTPSLDTLEFMLQKCLKIAPEKELVHCS